MEVPDFTLTALRSLGAQIAPQPPDLFVVEENRGREYIRFKETESPDRRSTLYAPGTAAFLRLVARVIATGIYDIEDLDRNPVNQAEETANQWIRTFGGTPTGLEIEETHRCFQGTALVRARATVAHDSYESLIEIPCAPAEHCGRVDKAGMGPLPHMIENPEALGINTNKIVEAAMQDTAIAEFSRFYLERRALEMQAAGDDARKSKKLEDDFTPRLELTLVALGGKLFRRAKAQVRYRFDANFEYQNTLTVTPHTEEWADTPDLGVCARSGKIVPATCLRRCEISGATVLQHLLVQSEISARLAQPEFTVLCSLSGKRVLQDEAEKSAVTGRMVASSLLKTSAVSGKRAEPEQFGQCEFTRTEVLKSELATSEISGKRYRIDEQVRSAVSGKTGHKQEFLVCQVTRQPVATTEAERCEVTGSYVRPGILQTCEITQKRVLPSELARCAVTGKHVLKGLLVTSSISGAQMLEKMAVRSIAGKYCAPAEAKRCVWSGRNVHPDDLRVCELTGLPIHVIYATENSRPRLQPLVELLDGIRRTADEAPIWDTVAIKSSATLRGARCRVEAAVLSPDRQHLAVCVEARTLLGLRVRHAGLLYAIGEHSIIGRVAQGRRSSEGWYEIKS